MVRRKRKRTSKHDFKLEKKGFIFESSVDGTWEFGKLSKAALQVKDYCEYCQQELFAYGTKIHGAQCPRCTRVLYQKMVPEKGVRFYFRKDPMFEEIHMFFHSEDKNNQEIRLFLSEENTIRQQDVLKRMKSFYRKEQIGEKEVYVFSYNLKNPQVSSPIQVVYAEDEKHVRTIRKYQGEDLSEKELPVPVFIILNRAWLLPQTVEEYLVQQDLNPDPSYYTGRESLVAKQHVVKIYQKIQTGLGEKAAQGYLNMIQNISSFSMSHILTTLYELEKNQWVWESSLEPTENPEQNAFEQWFLNSKTEIIRQEFLSEMSA